ncbi:Os08g0402366 [Oryza sativa Japonica Group]|uniref:Os08g0402366 protein n=1 Tax=Oryza sativa subsp. japonica TaxID=39947 RepID=A0A0P0XFR3_ORYSJ|nr:Os08g0402366 [Oryza sativa Japonica Group]
MGRRARWRRAWIGSSSVSVTSSGDAATSTLKLGGVCASPPIHLPPCRCIRPCGPAVELGATLDWEGRARGLGFDVEVLNPLA